MGLDGDADVVQPKNLIGEGEAYAVAGIAEGVGAAVKGLEYFLKVLFTNADTFIADTDDRGMVVHVQAAGDFVVIGEFDGVLHDIADGDEEQVIITLDGEFAGVIGQVVLEVDLAVGQASVPFIFDLPDQFVQTEVTEFGDIDVSLGELE